MKVLQVCSGEGVKAWHEPWGDLGLCIWLQGCLTGTATTAGARRRLQLRRLSGTCPATAAWQLPPRRGSGPRQ